MRLKSKTIGITFIIITIANYACHAEQTMSKAEALQLGTEAYIYGYPLVTMDLTKKIMTNVTVPTGSRGPMGRFNNLSRYPTAYYRDVTAPNADTLYSFAWLDLSKEPYILQVPEVKNRYYLMPMLSAWTNVFADPGTRTTGNAAHDFAIVGPFWKGNLPKQLIIIKSPTNLVWILGRTYCDGTPDDYEAVHLIQYKYKLIPLSSYGQLYTPPDGSVDPNIDMKTPVRDQVNALDADHFFKKLAALMQENPPTKEDAPMLAKLAKLGIIPGKQFSINKLQPEAAKMLNQSVKDAQKKIMAQEEKAGTIKNGWMITTKTGNYGTDYLQRAFIAAIGLGANLPQDAIYPTTRVDSTGQKLNGKNHYIIHFAKDGLPPVNAFWSLTMYDKNYYFVPNELNKFTISQRNPLKTNKDGSIDIYIQYDSPGPDKETNWLPAPNDDFILMFRFYWPKEKLITGQWVPPPVKRLY